MKEDAVEISRTVASDGAPFAVSRKINRRALLSTVGLAGASALISSPLTRGMPDSQAQTPNRAKCLRLDSHTHMDDLPTIKAYIEFALEQGITHYVGIVKVFTSGKRDSSQDKTLLPYLSEAGVTCIPFEWIDVFDHKDHPHLDESFAGYKIHPRQTDLEGRWAPPADSGKIFCISEDNVGKICEAAGKLHRPLLFHTDADVPSAGSLPMLADLARNHPTTTLIAAHLGVYPAEYFVRKYTAAEWEPLVEPLYEQNLRLLIETPNLYADTAIFGVDSPARTADPDFNFKHFVKVVDGLDARQKSALSNKLFIGTDFPGWWLPDPGERFVHETKFEAKDPRASYAYQEFCMRTALKQYFDGTRVAENFFRLIPPGFVAD